MNSPTPTQTGATQVYEISIRATPDYLWLVALSGLASLAAGIAVGAGS